MFPRMFSFLAEYGWQRVSGFKMIGTSVSRSISNSTIDTKEVRKFNDAANEWWEKYALLQTMNMVRVPFIRDGICQLNQCTVKDPYPLKNYKIIDVGCGGGMLSEPLARLGASVTGLDPGPENIETAINHASQDLEIKERLTYICDTVENVAISNPGMYDAVVCSEVIEHVQNVDLFIKCCVEITKEGGSLFFTTINRSLLSYMLAIVGGEYLLRVIPRGTHDWNKFITPTELSKKLQSLNCRVISKEGYLYNPITGKFNWSGKLDVFYALHVCK